MHAVEGLFNWTLIFTSTIALFVLPWTEHCTNDSSMWYLLLEATNAVQLTDIQQWTGAKDTFINLFLANKGGTAVFVAVTDCSSKFGILRHGEGIDPWQ